MKYTSKQVNNQLKQVHLNREERKYLQCLLYARRNGLPGCKRWAQSRLNVLHAQRCSAVALQLSARLRNG